MKSSTDGNVIFAMLEFGGSFVKALGEAAMRADLENLAKIKKTWPEIWENYQKLAISRLEGELAEAQRYKRPT